MKNSKTEIRVFYSYSHKDEKFREQLEEHLAIFKRAGLLQGWSDRKILPGNDWRSEIDKNLEKADLILVLVSSSFIASDYCYDNELGLAMSRHEAGLTRVVPIFVRPTEWRDAPFAGLQGLPKDALPITQWENEDVAWQNVAAGLKVVLEEIREEKDRTPALNRTKTLHEALTEEISRIQGICDAQSAAGVTGISSGFHDFDRLTTGLHGGQLVVLASRPAMGKTNLSLHIAGAVAEQDLPVLIFSTKMSARDVSRRMVTSRGRISFSSMETALLQDDDWAKLTAAFTAIADKAVLIDDSPSLNYYELRERCLREKEKLGALALVLIDSIDFLNNTTDRNRESVGAGIFLKSLARELGSTILVTSNLSRIVDSRVNKRPMLHDMDRMPDLVDEQGHRIKTRLLSIA